MFSCLGRVPMNDLEAIHVSMLGSRRLSYQDRVLDGKNIRSKRIWTLLGYLITHRGRVVTQAELIDLMYPNDRSNMPLNALKTLVHRARVALDQLAYTDGKQLILQHAGGYIWNPDISVEVDSERFEALTSAAAAPELDRAEQLRLHMEAIALYQGDFLADASNETWVIPIAAYYRYLYMDNVDRALESLTTLGRFSEVIFVAQKAIAIDPYEERFYGHLILALAETNQLTAAKSQYESMKKLFYSEFGVTPSQELQALYKRLSKTDNGVEEDLSVIKAQICEDDVRRGAFFCEYAFFRDIYRLEARTAARSGRPLHLCLLSVSGKNGAELSKRTRELVMKRLAAVISGSLRSGDVFSRYSVSQYVILLPMANFENSGMVMDRIIKKYRQDHAHSPAAISHSVLPVLENAPPV